MTLALAAGKTEPLMRVYGISPSSRMLSVPTPPSGRSCMIWRWKNCTSVPRNLKARDTG
jgi:hypothetical protein